MSESKMKMLRKMVGGHKEINSSQAHKRNWRKLKHNFKSFSVIKKHQLNEEMMERKRAPRLKRI